jgi:hypothetical protein
VGDSAGIDGADADQSVSSPSHSTQPSAVAGMSDAGMSDAGMSDAGMSDAGMSTVEYAVGTVVAAAFAAVLYKIVTGDSVIAGLTNLINTALNTTF